MLMQIFQTANSVIARSACDDPPSLSRAMAGLESAEALFAQAEAIQTFNATRTRLLRLRNDDQTRLFVLATPGARGLPRNSRAFRK
jgi:hypothetical protein